MVRLQQTEDINILFEEFAFFSSRGERQTKVQMICHMARLAHFRIEPERLDPTYDEIFRSLVRYMNRERLKKADQAGMISSMIRQRIWHRPEMKLLVVLATVDFEFRRI